MFPHNAELKLRTTLQYYTNLKLKRVRKQINKNQMPLFELTDEEKIQSLKELVKIAVEVNASVFNDFAKTYDLKSIDINKEWVKSTFNFLNDGKDFEKLKQLKAERMTELAKKLDINIKDGNITKAQLNAIKTNVSHYKNSKEIREIITKLESDKFSSGDINKLKEWLNNRNELIARNETGNLYAQECKDLMIENDIEYYIWRTMEDSRVRPEHEERDGKKFSVNGGIMPGEEFNCRCWAEPI